MGIKKGGELNANNIKIGKSKEKTEDSGCSC